MFHNAYFSDDVDIKKYAKMYYVIYKKLLELDKTNKNYVNGYFMYHNWLEGSAWFIDYDLLSKSKVSNFDRQKKHYDYDSSFLDPIKKIVSTKKLKTINVNGVDKINNYTEVFEYAFYKMGAIKIEAP